MASIWKRHTTAATPASPSPPTTQPVTLARHSYVAANGHTFVMPSRTGGQNVLGYKNRVPQPSSDSPSETFFPSAGPGLPPAGSATAQAVTVPAAVTQITGITATQRQLRPGSARSA
jgi:hypothetical protein